MTDDKDGSKTVIRPMPGGAFGGGAARAKPPPPAGGQKTVIGGLPPAGAGFGYRDKHLHDGNDTSKQRSSSELGGASRAGARHESRKAGQLHFQKTRLDC